MKAAARCRCRAAAGQAAREGPLGVPAGGGSPLRILWVEGERLSSCLVQLPGTASRGPPPPARVGRLLSIGAGPQTTHSELTRPQLPSAQTSDALPPASRRRPCGSSPTNLSPSSLFCSPSPCKSHPCFTSQHLLPSQCWRWRSQQRRRWRKSAIAPAPSPWLARPSVAPTASPSKHAAWPSARASPSRHSDPVAQVNAASSWFCRCHRVPAGWVPGPPPLNVALLTRQPHALLPFLC